MFRRGIFHQIKSVSRDGIDQPFIDMIINQDLSGAVQKFHFEVCVAFPLSKTSSLFAYIPERS